MCKINIRNTTLLKCFEDDFREKCKSSTPKEMPNDILEVYNKITVIQPEEVTRLANIIKNDLAKASIYVKAGIMPHIQYLDYWRYYQYDDNPSMFKKYSVGPSCSYDKKWIKLETRSSRVKQEERYLGVFFEPRLYEDVEDFIAFYRSHANFYKDYYFPFMEISNRQLKIYLHLACKQIERAGFFNQLVQNDILKLPFYVSAGQDSDADGGGKNPIMFVLNL